MKLENVKTDVKIVLAMIVILVGLYAMIFRELNDMVLGAMIGYISLVLNYFFSSSSGSTAKDKIIQEINTQSIIGGSTPPKDKDEK